MLIFPEPKANPFKVIALDFITKLPKSQKYDLILTITDHDCSKASLFIPCTEEITAEGVAELFVQRVFQYYGLPQKIISDRDPRFTSKFTRKLCHLLGIKQNVSTAYHPRTDRQSERTNQWLETYLQFFVNYQQDNWAVYLPLAEFAHNNWMNASTGESPFYLLMGSHPRAEWSDAPSTLPQVTRQLRQIKEIRAGAQEAMTRAQMMWVKHRNTTQYHEGDLVWLEGRNLCTNQPITKLAARHHRPFPVEQVLSPVTYKLSLPSTWNIHPVFHVDLLTPYRETSFHEENYQRPPVEPVQGIKEYKVEAVLDMRHYGRKKKRQYLVKWKGYPDSDNEWVDHRDMNAPEAIQEYEEAQKDNSRLRHLADLPNTQMSSLPISISSNSPTHHEILDVLVAASASDLAEARATFPTPEPGHLSPNSTFSVDVDLSPTTHVNAIGVEAEVGCMAGGAGAEDTGRAAEVSPEVGSRCTCSSDLLDAGPCTCRGYHCQGTSEATCTFWDSIRTCNTHGTRCLFCTHLVKDCRCNAQSTYRPEILQALEGVLEAARGAHLPPQEPRVVLSAQQRQHFIRLTDSDSKVNGEEGEEVPPTTRTQGRRGGRQNRRRGGPPTVIKMREEVQRRIASPPVSRQPPPYTDPAYECPQGFWVNVPPNFISIRV